MANTDPFYCHQHKTWQWMCASERHSWETDLSFKARREFETLPAHPECPSCRCVADQSFQPQGRLHHQ